MLKYYLKVLVYLLAYVVSLIGLRALDYNRFIKKGRVFEAQLLYILIGMAMAYLIGNLLINIIYYFNV